MAATFQFKPCTDEEQVKVAKNKQRLIDDKCEHTFTDIAVLRFIRGHKGNEDKAYHFMQKHVNWRKEEKVGEIHESSIVNMINSKAARIFGQDNRGRPIVNVLARRHNTYTRDIAEVRRFIIYLLETTMGLTRPEEEQLTIVFDLHQFGMQCMDYEAVKMLVEILQFNFPDVLGQAFIVNAPFIFYACWYVIQAWLDPVTASKVVFCTSVELKDHVDEASLMMSIGSDECPDPEGALPREVTASE